MVSLVVNSISNTVECFLIAIFSGVNVYMQTPTSEFNQGHSTMKMCIHLPSTAVCTFARCPSEAAVDPATVTLVNIPANIFVFFNTL